MDDFHNLQFFVSIFLNTFHKIHQMINYWRIVNKYNVIVSGRALTTIYPDLDYHFFVTADLEERVNRKCIQYGNKEKFEEIKANIVKRDKLQEEAGFYKLSKNTKEIDVTECKTVQESTKKVLNNIKLPQLV